jgi:hypothetical protein
MAAAPLRRVGMSGETEEAVSGWTVDTLRVAIKEWFDVWCRLLDERYNMQTKFLDERYNTQTKALDAAFKAAELAVAAALASAEKAVVKAEGASDKRFEAVNEFRQQLADQATTFMRRDEAEIRLTGLTDALALLRTDLSKISTTIVPRDETDVWRQQLSDKVDVFSGRLAELELRLTRRLDLGQGEDEGKESVTGTRFQAASVAEADRRARTSQLIAVAAVIIAIAAIVVTILVHK